MTKLEETVNLMKEENTFRRYDDGDHKHKDFSKQIFNEDKSHKCPTYIHKTPPCQGSCPSGEDIRGWLQIVRGIEKAPEDYVRLIEIQYLLDISYTNYCSSSSSSSRAA